jgi:DNA mismatch repair protein MutS2
MQAGALRALEFDRIVAAVRSFALTPTGAIRLGDLQPETDRATVAESLSLTTETVRYLADAALFPLRAPADLEDLLALLAVQGRALEPLRLLALTDYLESIDTTAAAIRRAGGQFRRLSAIAAQAASFRGEIADVRRRIAPPGDVVDDASPALAGIRDRLRRQRARLRSALESYLRGKDTAKYLQDQVVTERNGRSVLLVRAEHKGAIPGLVHGSSASGATLFLEPMATVEVNNDLVALAEEEAEEVRRILLELTDEFRGRALDLARSERVATELDSAQAKARLAAVMGAVEPQLSEDGRLELLGARHPLLMRGVVSRIEAGDDETWDPERLPEVPVPVTIRLIPPDTALLITGPNTGGKTVALKTAGLLALMAQAGLHVPAEAGSRVPVFRSIFADIGDEQSIATSLSTFGWHVTNIASMDRGLSLPALVLLDEIGAGTDPIEGGALGVAIVEHFRSRGALVMGTTHYDALKSYASTTPGVVCAAFNFDPHGFKPTYELVYGSPGRSLALEMAARLGLGPTIVEAARANLGVREAQLNDHLARMDQDLRELADERRLVARERASLAEATARAERREGMLRDREEAFKKRLNERIDERVREARKEIDAVVQALKRQQSALALRSVAAPRLSTGDQGTLRAQARSAVESIAGRARGEALEPAPEPDTVEMRAAVVGDRVLVGPFGLEGTVRSLAGGQAEIDVRGKRMRAPIGDVRVLAGARTPDAAAATARVKVDLQPRPNSSSDLNVIGCTVDEALDKAGRFLDDTLITDQRRVRLIHGHGTGQLRKAIAGFLKDHPLVERFHPEAQEQGGNAVTVVELRD